jgi:P4 family phage/plasmid primase-like protien
MQNPVEFKKYIQKHGFITNDDNNNYQFIPGRGEPGWKLNVPFGKQEEFLTNYYNMKVNKGLVSGLLEKPHTEHNQIRIDIDLKYLLKKNKDRLGNTHQYKLTTIKKLIKKYVEITSEYINIPAKGVNFTVFEKPKSTVKGGIKESEQYIKDGVHIMCPDLVIDNVILHAIYDDVINDKECKAIVDEFQSDEEINKVIDEAVISRNCWFLLGSGKPSDDPDSYYKVSTNYLVKFNTADNTVKMTENKLVMNELQQVIYFSNYNKNKNVEPHDDVNISVLEKRVKKVKQRDVKTLTDIDRLELQNRSRNNNNKIDLHYIEHLVDCLSDERVSTYELWFKVGVCLFNISSNLYSLFEKWSSKWPRFNRNEVFSEWHTKISNYGTKYSLGLTQLKRYAQEDNPNKFLKLTNIEKQNHINKFIDEINNQPTLNGKPSLKKVIGALDFAKFIAEYIEMHCEWNIKCADNTGGCVWYKFDNGLWSEDKNANKIYRLFSKEILSILKKTHKRWSIELIEHEGNSIGDGYESDSSEKPVKRNGTETEIMKQIIRNKLSTILQINEFIQKSANRSNLIKDISQENFDPEFYKQLNENRNIFVCNNCVLDLENLEIRKGLPEDMSTIKTDIDFPMNIENEEANECFAVISDLLDKIYPLYDVQEYIMNIFAESLSGVQRRDKFHIHTGSGGNGKSVIFDLIAIVFGEYNDSPDATIYTYNLSNPNDVNPVIAGLKGKRIIVTGEQKKDTPFNSAGVKKLTGGDPITGRHLRKDPITFKPQATFHACMNDIPQMDGPVDGGVERRMEIFEYPAKFLAPGDKKLSNPKKYPHCHPRDEKFRDANYLRKLAPYFLRMLWDRYCALQKDGFAQILNEEHIPYSVTKYTREYMQSSNAIDQYITEKIEYKPGYKQKINEIFKDFKKYTTDTFSKSYNQNDFICQFKRRINDGRVGKERNTAFSYDNVIIGQGEEYEQ